MQQPGLHGRHRDKNGEISRKHGNTLVSTLRKIYGPSFVPGAQPGEKLSEVYLGPTVGGGIETWFAYGLALCFLLFRPQGLFGDKIIDRV